MEFNNLSFTNDIKDKDQNEINEQIDIYIKQRNGRKCITIIQGLINDKDLRETLICRGIKLTESLKPEAYLESLRKVFEEFTQYRKLWGKHYTLNQP